MLDSLARRLVARSAIRARDSRLSGCDRREEEGGDSGSSGSAERPMKAAVKVTDVAGGKSLRTTLPLQPVQWHNDEWPVCFSRSSITDPLSLPLLRIRTDLSIACGPVPF